MDNSTLYQSRILSQLAQKYENRDYIADKILKPVDVPNIIGQYHVWDRAVTFRVQNTTYGPDASANQIDVKATKSSFTLVDHALKAYIDERELNQAPEVAIRAVKTRALTNALLLKKESLAAAQLFSSSVMTTGGTLSGTSQWSHASSTGTLGPKYAILTAARSLIKQPNTLVMSRAVYDTLQLHSEVVAAIQYSQGAVDTREILARYFQVDQILVGQAFYDTANEGQTESLGAVWGKHCLLCYVAPGASSPLMDEVSVGYLPRWGGGDAGGIRVYTSTNPERGTGAGAQMIKAEMSYLNLITSPACGYLFTNAVA